MVGPSGWLLRDLGSWKGFYLRTDQDVL